MWSVQFVKYQDTNAYFSRNPPHAAAILVVLIDRQARAASGVRTNSVGIGVRRGPNLEDKNMYVNSQIGASIWNTQEN